MERCFPNARMFHSADQKARVMYTPGCWENIASLNIKKKFSVYIPALKTKILFDFDKSTNSYFYNFTRNLSSKRPYTIVVLNTSFDLTSIREGQRKFREIAIFFLFFQ